MRKAFGENFIFVNFETPSKFFASLKGVVETCIQKQAVKVLKCDYCHQKKIFDYTPKNKFNRILCDDCFEIKRFSKIYCVLCAGEDFFITCHRV